MRAFFFFTFINLVISPVFGQAQSQKTPIERIEDILSIHYLKPEMKSPFDKIEIKDNQVFISVWRDLPPEPKAEKIECLGYQWLLSGRGQKVGQGAAAVFKEFPDLEAVHLDFVKVDYQLISKKGEPGKYERKGIPTAYLSMTAEKSKLPKESFSKEALQVQENCLKVGRNYISKKEIKL